jgi:type I restriction enzyme S subunit
MEEGRALPVGWANATIGELNSHESRAVNPLETPEVTYELYSVPAFPSRLPELLTGSEIGSTKQVVEPHDVLICKINPRINRIWNVGDKSAYPQIASSEWIILRSPGLCSSYLRNLFAAPFFREILCEGVTGVGGSLTRAQPKKVREFVIPLAPLNEQRRIAAKLDTTLAAIDACRQRLDGVEALLKRFRQAVLAAATSGELTREWREERGIADEWNAAQLGPLLNDMRYGTAKKCSYEAVGLPVLRIPNILESGCICQADLKYADFDAQEVAKLSLLPGDLLVIRSNGSLDLVGRVAEASEKDAGMLFAGYLIRLRPNQDKILSPYLQLALRSPSTRSTIELAARSTSGVNNINSQFLSSLAIPLPAVQEQQEIVRHTQSLFSLADQLEAKLTSARKTLERLTPALLAKAFRGELVPQDPGDEPASVLLERIRAARQAEAGAGKPSRR